MNTLLRLVFVFSVLTKNVVNSHASLVDAPAGKIEGKIIYDLTNRPYSGFVAIPYALPPVGELRFAKPKPHPKFEGTFSATNEIVACPGYGLYAFLEPDAKEDCLTLNVYTKEVNLRQKRKVLVFIHGGGFVFGSARNIYPGSFVIDHDVIVVTIQYRLGIFGFLSSGDETSPGNFGLWDQVLALGWVQKNIAAFGGDPDDITITGESAGGTAVSLISISPASKGLFTKVYPQSGAATSAFAFAPTPQRDMLHFANHTGCWDGAIDQPISSSKSAKIIACLRKLPHSKIIPYAEPMLVKPKFVPVIDGDFLPRQPLELLNDKDYLDSIGFYDKAYLIVTNNNEASLLHRVVSMTEAAALRFSNDASQEEKSAILNDHWSDYWKYYSSLRRPQGQADDKTVLEVKDWYGRRYEGQEALIQLVSDLWFLVPSFDFLDAASRGDNARVWQMSFDYYPRFMKGSFRGCPHAMDLAYWLDIPMTRLPKMMPYGIQGEMDEEDHQLKAKFQTLIADFVKTGDPGASLNAKMVGKWPTYDEHSGFYLSFKSEPTIEHGLDFQKRRFWYKK